MLPTGLGTNGRKIIRYGNTRHLAYGYGLADSPYGGDWGPYGAIYIYQLYIYGWAVIIVLHTV